MEVELFDDLIDSCNEAVEYEHGNIELNVSTVTIPDEETGFYGVYTKLSKTNKQKAMNYVNELLRASNE